MEGHRSWAPEIAGSSPASLIPPYNGEPVTTTELVCGDWEFVGFDGSMKRMYQKDGWWASWNAITDVVSVGFVGAPPMVL